MQLNELQISELLSLLLSIFDDGDVVSRSAVSNDFKQIFSLSLLDTAPPSGGVHWIIDDDVFSRSAVSNDSQSHFLFISFEYRALLFVFGLAFLRKCPNVTSYGLLCVS